MDFGFVQRILNELLAVLPGVRNLRKSIDEAKVLAAKALIAQVRAQGVLEKISDAEFKAFSQFGDDGIIQYLIHILGIENETFVEFGVEDYTEANTRFLLVNNNWRGLVIDGDPMKVESILRDEIAWRYDLTAVSAFVTRENINEILTQTGFAGELGILSIDIDGNDYWVWEQITAVQPTLVIAEYNSVFGLRPVSIPYDPNFTRMASHYSGLYWGCSLGALHHLATQKGYALVGCNSSGNNAYFVRRDRLGPLKALDIAEAYVPAKFRESRDREGRLTFLSGKARKHAMADMTVVDVRTGEMLQVGDLD